MRRAERRTGPDIGRDGTENGGGTRSLCGLDDITEVAAEMAVARRHARVVPSDLTGQKGFHAHPFALGLSGLTQGLDAIVHQLSESTFLAGRNAEIDETTTGIKGIRQGGRTVGADDLVVARVDDEDIGIENGAVLGDAPGHVRIHGGHRCIDDLEGHRLRVGLKQDL